MKVEVSAIAARLPMRPRLSPAPLVFVNASIASVSLGLRFAQIFWHRRAAFTF